MLAKTSNAMHKFHMQSNSLISLNHIQLGDLARGCIAATNDPHKVLLLIAIDRYVLCVAVLCAALYGGSFEMAMA